MIPTSGQVWIFVAVGDDDASLRMRAINTVHIVQLLEGDRGSDGERAAVLRMSNGDSLVTRESFDEVMSRLTGSSDEVGRFIVGPEPAASE